MTPIMGILKNKIKPIKMAISKQCENVDKNKLEMTNDSEDTFIDFIKFPFEEMEYMAPLVACLKKLNIIKPIKR